MRGVDAGPLVYSMATQAPNTVLSTHACAPVAQRRIVHSKYETTNQTTHVRCYGEDRHSGSAVDSTACSVSWWATFCTARTRKMHVRYLDYIAVVSIVHMAKQHSEKRGASPASTSRNVPLNSLVRKLAAGCREMSGTREPNVPTAES